MQPVHHVNQRYMLYICVALQIMGVIENAMDKMETAGVEFQYIDMSDVLAPRQVQATLRKPESLLGLYAVPVQTYLPVHHVR